MFYIRTQCVPRCKHFPPRLYKTNLLRQCKANSRSLFSDAYKTLNAMSAPCTTFLNVKPGGALSNRQTLKDYITIHKAMYVRITLKFLQLVKPTTSKNVRTTKTENKKTLITTLIIALTGNVYKENLISNHTVIPRLTSDPANEFFG